MAYRVEIRPPEGAPYSLAKLFVDYLEACDEGTSYRYAPLYARFDVRAVDPALADNHFRQRSHWEATQTQTRPGKPVATSVLVSHFLRDAPTPSPSR